jgi:hypothetical protein
MEEYMNERIIELAKQSLKDPDDDNDGLMVFDHDELKKFAELIIRECAGQCLSDDCMRILNRFGIEH